MRVLIVEDEAPLRNGLLKLLREEGYAADAAVNGEEGLRKAMECDYDAIVLDYLMPVMDGREMLRRLRHTKRTPVMMLTARNSVDDRVAGLDLGADDYVAKPFVQQELLARLEALVRRARRREEVLAYKELRLYPRRMEAFRGERRLALSPKAFLLLKAFLEAPEEVLSKEALMRKVWGEEVEPATLEVHLSALRKALGEPSPIQTVRGYGYRLFLPEG